MCLQEATLPGHTHLPLYNVVMCMLIPANSSSFDSIIFSALDFCFM